MKIINKTGDHCLLKISQEEWQDIGEKQNWLEPPRKKSNEPEEPNGSGAHAEKETKPDLGEPHFLLPIGDRLETRVEQHTEKSWAVYVQGKLGEQLLCITADLRSAAFTKKLLDELM